MRTGAAKGMNRIKSAIITFLVIKDHGSRAVDIQPCLCRFHTTTCDQCVRGARLRRGRCSSAG
jgi:hypothetical protein